MRLVHAAWDVRRKVKRDRRKVVVLLRYLIFVSAGCKNSLAAVRAIVACSDQRGCGPLVVQRRKFTA